ncbi:MAG: hypothetical protein JST19_11635 [Bacteroidetes bacterium]|nr:hypothetical protein [Bacteroidota bacterium]
MRRIFFVLLIGLSCNGCQRFNKNKSNIYTREYLDSSEALFSKKVSKLYLVRDTFLVMSGKLGYIAINHKWEKVKGTNDEWQMQTSIPEILYEILDEGEYREPTIIPDFSIKRLYLSTDKTKLYSAANPAIFWKKVN